MIFSSPFLGYPYRNYYSRYGYRYPSYRSSYQTYSTPSNFSRKEQKKEIPKEKSNEEKRNTKVGNEENAPLFEIFGISLYFDDILLVCLIFFLYQEGVEDQSLFIALILLLLS